MRSSAAVIELDRQLVERVLAKDPTVIEDIVRTYKREVYHLALQLCRDHDDAEDLTQEVFIRAWKSLDSFRGDARLSTWLHRITVNLYLNIARSKEYIARKQWDSFDEEVMSGTQSAEYDPEHELFIEQLRQHVDEALTKLSPAQRTAFILRHYYDLSIREIAERMNNTEGTVKVLLFRAVRNLQKLLSFYRDNNAASR
ncbi:MAG: sigma-70 family RNA polymerase sigma factor [Bacteroidota bacterium]|nr:sigma-70 family RNA polymerase sigma factor [Candidatus Kapabacteria bacterium]MDW8075355.1 sigma-70 family RNA polymerase sigma factor [Bacteroidota bacterium]MDW8272140.1 sigma-70 family RNA polymerase sigma factor [Bacteroidota bacterium]